MTLNGLLEKRKYLDDNGNFDYWLWRNEFDKECHGYKRIFNIVSYGAHPDDLPDKTMLSYQPEQSLNFADEEIPEVSGTGIDIYKKVSSNIDEFLRYRRLIETSDETGEETENIDGHLRNNRELKKWFKFQTTGIVTGMYDTLALSLNGADYDGDTVCTTDNMQKYLKAGQLVWEQRLKYCSHITGRNLV